MRFTVLQVAIADTDGDLVPDMLLGDQFRACLFSGRTGAVRTFATQSSYGYVAIVGDLNGDGFGDVALDDNDFLRFVSSGTGATLAQWRYGQFPSLGRPTSLLGLGDIDSDGFGDLALGNSDEGPPQQAGGFELLSSGILAEATLLDGACGGGPFLPQLGLSRPVLGQTMTVACRDGTLGAVGVLLLSRAPAVRTYLGVSTCYLWLDFGTTSPLFTTSQPTWSLPIPVPNVSALAGFEIGMQVVYGPSLGPLNFDLSNGVRGRFGY